LERQFDRFGPLHGRVNNGGRGIDLSFIPPNFNHLYYIFRQLSRTMLSTVTIVSVVYESKDARGAFLAFLRHNYQFLRGAGNILGVIDEIEGYVDVLCVGWVVVINMIFFIVW
jgi:hypothetical protein